LLLLPGSTLLDRNEYLALDALDRITCHKLAIGVAFCARNDKVDLSTARNINLPIGSRDPFTHKHLVAAGLESHFVGCPTLLIGKASRWQHRSGPLIISLGPGPQRLLRECVLACAKFGNVILLEHVPRLQPRFPLPTNVRRVKISSAAQAIDLYSSAAAVLTGRIHGYLTCVSLGVPVTFFGSWYDSRFSLLEYLGTQLEDPVPDRIVRVVDKMLNQTNLSTLCLERAAELRAKMINYLNGFGIPVQ
jgi:Polysaccharide pyruvyl transferase